MFVVLLDYQLYFVGVVGRFNKLSLFGYILIFWSRLVLIFLHTFIYDALITSEPIQIHSLQEMAWQLSIYNYAFIYL
jgi:hypothetical protein